MPTLNIQELSVSLSGQRLLHSVDLQVRAGELVAIIGPNGAGKSTLLKAIAGDVSILNGNVKIAGTAESTVMEQAKQIAVLPQFSLLNFPYTVYEVVELGRIPHNTGRDIDGDIIHQALEAVDISHLSDKAYTQLSGGEKQRVQIARVLTQIWRAEDAPTPHNRLLLLDEPTTALDLGHQQLLMALLKSFAQSPSGKVAVLMVLHDINLAARYADKLLALCCGEVIGFGSPKEVITPEKLKLLFSTDVDVIDHPKFGTPVVLNS